MGCYLSKPKTEKTFIEESSKRFSFVAVEMQGWRLEMEDAHINYLDETNDIYIFGVFDGHGGAEVARFIGAHFVEKLLECPEFKEKKYKESLTTIFYQLDDMIIDLKYSEELKKFKNNQPSDSDPLGHEEEPFTAGCTANVVLIVGNNMYIANAGDSRSVLATKNGYEELSIDHKPDDPKEKDRIIKAGGNVYNGRVNGNLSLSRAFGDFDYKKDQSLKKYEQLIIVTPEIKERKIDDNCEFIVVGCDGIWETWSSEQVVEFVRKGLKEFSRKEVGEKLLNSLLAKDTSAIYGLDNMTCIIVNVNK